MSWESPFCRSAAVPEVRTSAIMNCACWAWVVQILAPVSRQPEPSGTARVVTLARSEPAFGSLMPMQKKDWPATMRGMWKRRCASLPKRRISGPLCRSAIQCAATGAPAASSSSTST